MPLREQIFREDAQIILVQHLFHQIQQLQGACGQVFAVIDLLCTAAHAPPVIHRPGTGSIAVPCTVKNGTHDLDIKRIPPPHGQAQRLQTAVRHAAHKAVIPVGAFRLPVIAGIEDLHILPVGEIQRVHRVLQAGPAQHHFCLRPHGLQALRKGIYRRRDAIHRVCRHIAHAVGPCHHAGQHSQQIGHFIRAGIVGAHQRMRRVE